MRELARAYQAFSHYSDSHIRELGLTPPQFDVISTLGGTEGMNMKDLAAATLVTKGTLTGIVDRLEKRQLVRREVPPENRRSFTIVLTKAGEALFQEVFPVAQLSLPAHWAPAQLLALGSAIAPLRKKGVLILASGSATHNFRAFWGRSLSSPVPDWVRAFEQWLIDSVEKNDWARLQNYQQAPYIKENHPTPEHLLPLFVALGAGDQTYPGKLLHRSTTYGIFSMAAFSFGQAELLQQLKPKEVRLS